MLRYAMCTVPLCTCAPAGGEANLGVVLTLNPPAVVDGRDEVPLLELVDEREDDPHPLPSASAAQLMSIAGPRFMCRATLPRLAAPWPAIFSPGQSSPRQSSMRSWTARSS